MRSTVARWWRSARERVAREVPSREELAAHRWLRPVAHRLHEPGLWHLRREAVARGTAIGVFWAFAIPFAQIVVAAAHCIWWRGNIPVAAAITFVTNPLTIGFWLYLAYRLGNWLLAPVKAGAAASVDGAALAASASTVLPPAAVASAAEAAGWAARLHAFGWPTVVGMAVFAVGGASAGYLLVHAGHRVWAHWRIAARQRRLRRRTRG
jgi:uncharacterized protein (DUF2062 family)